MALEAAAGAQVDWAEFVVIRRRCAWSLATFGATMWLMADVGWRRQGGAASSVARRLRGCSRWFETAGVLDGMRGMCGDC